MANTLGRKSYARIPNVLTLPSLIEVQIESFKWFLREGLTELFEEVSPIESFNGGMQLWFPSKRLDPGFNLKYWFDEPKYNMDECVERDMTFAAPLYVSVLLTGNEVPNPIKNDIFLGDFPLMTENGTFIVNGTERVVVSQLIRSPGVYFEAEEDRTSGRRLASAKLIPDRGAWMEFETRKSDYLTLKFNRKRTIPVTILLRALATVSDGLPESAIKEGTDEEILALFKEVDTNPDHLYIPATLRQEPTWEPKDKRTVAQEALVEFYKRMRPGDPPTLDNAREFLDQQLFDQRRYDLERVGRYKLNQRLEKDLLTLRGALPEERVLTPEDLVAIGRHIIRVDNGEGHPDDIDHLGNRRVRTVGELIQNQFRIGLLRMERVVKERMSIIDPKVATPANLINIRPVIAALREFFGGSQLSQFMDQTNPLAELTHKRRLSALGPGGLSRERAGFDVRDVHHSHYGRVCPIETPEGPNIGLIGSLATYARLNPYGFIETPYRRVTREFENADPRLIGRTIREKVTNREGKAVAEAGSMVDEKLFQRLSRLAPKNIQVVPSVSSSPEDIEYLSADREEDQTIAQANTRLDAQGHFLEEKVEVRRGSRYSMESPLRIDYMDVSPKQIVSVATSLIPFLEHDDANRALMGSNMQRQSVPLLQPRAPILITGMERLAGRDSGQVVFARREGIVASVTSNEIRVMTEEGEEVHPLMKFIRTNNGTCLNQRPLVDKGERVRAG